MTRYFILARQLNETIKPMSCCEDNDGTCSILVIECHIIHFYTSYIGIEAQGTACRSFILQTPSNIIGDDHAVFRRGNRDILHENFDPIAIEEAQSGLEMITGEHLLGTL